MDLTTLNAEIDATHRGLNRLEEQGLSNRLYRQYQQGCEWLDQLDSARNVLIRLEQSRGWEYAAR